MMHLKNLDETKDKLNSDQITPINENHTVKKKIEDSKSDINFTPKGKNQLKSTDQIKTSPAKNLNNQDENKKVQITSFQDLINQANLEKEIELKYDLERNVKLVSFNKGKMDISFNERLNKNFIKNLSEKLLDWTGERWIISLSKNSDVKSIFEKKLENKNSKMVEFKNSKVSKELKAAFPDAELIDIKED